MRWFGVGASLFSTAATAWMVAQNVAGEASILLGMIVCVLSVLYSLFSIERDLEEAAATGEANPIKREIAKKNRREGAEHNFNVSSVYFVGVWFVWLSIGRNWPKWAHVVSPVIGGIVGFVGVCASFACAYSRDVRRAFSTRSPQTTGAVVLAVATLFLPVNVSTDDSPTEMLAHWAIFAAMFFANVTHGLAFSPPGLKFDLVLCQSVGVLHAPIFIGGLGLGATLYFYWSDRYVKFRELENDALKAKPAQVLRSALRRRADPPAQQPAKKVEIPREVREKASAPAPAVPPPKKREPPANLESIFESVVVEREEEEEPERPAAFAFDPV